MIFSIMGLVLGRVLAEREGIQDSSTLNRMAVLGGVVGASPFGLVMTRELARREGENEVAKGVVVPQAGGGAPAGSVTKSFVYVPDVTVRQYADAVAVLQNVYLLANRVDVLSETDQGEVVSQVPKGDEIVPVGTTVTLYVSLGPQTKEVPAIEGYSVDDALAALTKAGFHGEVKLVRKGERAGVVELQDPQGRTRALPGSNVVLYVTEARPESRTCN